jgi:protease I
MGGLVDNNKLAGKKVAILVADGFEQVEMTEPKRALEEAGARTSIVSPAQGEVQGWKHFDKADRFPVDLALSDARAESFDALLLPGGVANPDQLRIIPEAVAFVRQFFDAGKPVAAICHGLWPLIDAGVVSGRTVTSWPSLRPTSPTPARAGSTRRSRPTTAWSPAASPTTFRPSIGR